MIDGAFKTTTVKWCNAEGEKAQPFLQSLPILTVSSYRQASQVTVSLQYKPEKH